MEELRIDCRNQTAEELAKAKELRHTTTRASKPRNVLWLCSEQASFVDGHALLVDGAFSIH